MPTEQTRSHAIADPDPTRENCVVELVLLASEWSEDAFEVDDLVADWLQPESPEPPEFLSQDPIFGR